MDNKPSPDSYFGLTFFLILNLLGLPVWFFAMILGYGDFEGKTILDIVLMLPISLYPMFIFVFSIISFRLNAAGREGKAAIVMLIPLIVSGGYIFLLMVVDSFIDAFT